MKNEWSEHKDFSMRESSVHLTEKETGFPHLPNNTPPLQIVEVQFLINKYRAKVEASKKELASRQKTNKELEAEIKVLRGRQAKSRAKARLHPRSDPHELEKMATKATMLETKALSLRAEIDRLRREKFLFISMNNNLVEDISTRRAQLLKLEEQKAKVAEMRRKMEEQRKAEHLADSEKLALAEAGLSNFKTSLRLENQKRQKELMNSFVGSKFQGDQDPSADERDDPDLSVGDESDLEKNKTIKVAIANQRKQHKERKEALRAREEKLKKEIVQNETLLKEIFKVTNTNSVDELVLHFSQLEDANNELFKTTKLLMEDVEEVQGAKAVVQAQIAQSQMQKSDILIRKDQEITEAHSRLEAIQKQIEDSERKENELKNTISAMKLGLPAIIDKIATSLGEEDEINQDSSISSLLAQMERLTNCVMAVVKETQVEGLVFDPHTSRPEEKLPNEKVVDEEQSENGARESKFIKTTEGGKDDRMLIGEARNELIRKAKKNLNHYFNQVMKKKAAPS